MTSWECKYSYKVWCLYQKSQNSLSKPPDYLGTVCNTLLLKVNFQINCAFCLFQLAFKVDFKYTFYLFVIRNFFENFRLLKLRTLGSRNLMLTEWKTTSLQNAVWPKSHKYVTVIREVSNSNTSKAVWLYEQKAWRSMFYYITQSSLAWQKFIFWHSLKHHLTTFDNHKASFDNNIIFITFMVKINYIYGEPNYIHG